MCVHSAIAENRLSTYKRASLKGINVQLEQVRVPMPPSIAFGNIVEVTGNASTEVERGGTIAENGTACHGPVLVLGLRR